MDWTAWRVGGEAADLQANGVNPGGWTSIQNTGNPSNPCRRKVVGCSPTTGVELQPCENPKESEFSTKKRAHRKT